MRCTEEDLIAILEDSGVDVISSLPCDRIKLLLSRIDIICREKASFLHVPLVREEEGVGISAGVALAGKRPAMFLQSSGVGNMINALLSLTLFYELPLAIFISHRGVYREKIAAQVPIGRSLTKILRGAGIPYSIISSKNDFRVIRKKLLNLYAKNRVHAFLLSPAIWEGTTETVFRCYPLKKIKSRIRASDSSTKNPKPRYTRFEILQTIAPYMGLRVVICNLGWPSKELFAIKHQRSNFYMLGSMGMATPIGLGIALVSQKQVFVVDGDGSLLMNPGTLATAGHFSPANLSIIAIDNSSYGSTGDQPTLTGSCVDLETVARGFGIRNTYKVSGKKDISDAMSYLWKGLSFVHILAVPGNEDVPNIPLHHLTNKRQVQAFLGLS